MRSCSLIVAGLSPLALNFLALTLLALTILALTGCGVTPRHDFQPFQVAGVDLPIEVAVPHADGDVVRGTLHHRQPGDPEFTATPMTLQADHLYTVLPAGHTEPQNTLEYYIDVTRNDTLYPLRTPGHPYVVTFLDADEMIRDRLSDKSTYSDAHHDVLLVLETQGQPVDQPEVVYEMPGVPGRLRSPMTRDTQGDYRLTIPTSSVNPGVWRYAIEARVNGTVYRLPERGFTTIIVGQGYPPKIAKGAVR